MRADNISTLGTPLDSAASPTQTSSRKTLADNVRMRLIEEIVTGSYPPGAKLDEASLAARFDVSRTPVREALRQLVNSGLVVWRPRQGAVVAKVSVQEMIEMFEMMAELEGFAGRLAARRMTDDERSQLKLLLEKGQAPAQNGDRQAYQRHNRAFHMAIYRGSHNHCLQAQASMLYDRLAPYRAYELNRHGEILRVYQEHKSIVDAILARDSESVYHLLKQHAMLDVDLLGDLAATLGR